MSIPRAAWTCPVCEFETDFPKAKHTCLLEGCPHQGRQLVDEAKKPATPEQTDGDFMTGAYVGFLHWAISEPGVLKKFKEETGLRFLPMPKSGLEALIDAACELDKERDKTLLKFIVWVTIALWGEDLVPSFYFKLKESANE